ncbi:DNA polymerase lambda, fingers domain [Pseudocohnilembus persalinus]|uniref:DNA polymerase n=1 Tax=Pseudocohnilembus persalinus TaxID=266149 RepID=A0A0V0R642_PSEPJ|nr:DNA polymerase lambda, fingers domain [Pseudocohnilembus persalinus]|eukprot:KRX09967.1 DNA polymerase lambda, fingers domain [Pseudocohnilembus persalinus]
MGCHNFLDVKKIQNIKQDEQDSQQDDENIQTNSKNILYKDTFKNIKEQQRQAYKYDRSLWDYTYDDDEYCNKNQQCLQTKINGISEEILPVQPLQPELDELREYYKQMKDKGREIAYKKAIAAIKTVDLKIDNEEQVNKIPYIGRKMKEKIKQIIKNGFTKKQQKVVQYNKKFVIMKTFGQIWGIGPNFALDLYQQGIETIEQLQDNINLLNKSQKIGLKYYYDFQQKIPRKETEEIFQLVQNAVKQLEKYQGGFFKIDQNGQKIESEQIKIACPDENSVFRVLGLEYKTPQQRNI